MRALDLVGSAAKNTLRSKTRTTLTVLAVFVGAFTLTLTSGLGTGVNRYIADTLSGIGAADAMSVTRASDDGSDPFGGSSGPREYDPDAIASGVPGATVTALGPDDIEALRGIEGVVDAEAVRTITPDYVRFGDGDRFVASVGSLVPGQTTVLAAGREPDPGSPELELALPAAYVEALGFADDRSAIGGVVGIGITDAERSQHVVEARVVGVAEETLANPMGSSLIVNTALSDALFVAQSTGLTAEQADRYASATVRFDPGSTGADVQALKERLSAAGFTGTTIADQLGAVTAVIDGIVLVLNAFAIIALLAAAFGIVNTLYMSVQERTKEIGLMKAMGMGSGRIFSLFSLEAAFLGLLGSAIGAGLAMLVGSALSAGLSQGPLSDLAGLTLIAFDPASIASIVLAVTVIAFLAGTLPAVRAARADPVDSLRYE